jgi:hypothetical protein
VDRAESQERTVNKAEQIKPRITIHFLSGPTILIHETNPNCYDSFVITPDGRSLESTSPERRPSDATIKAMRNSVEKSQNYNVRVELPNDHHWCIAVCMFLTERGWIASGLVVCDMSQYAYSEHETHFGALVGMIGVLIG